MDDLSLRIADKTWPVLSRVMGGHTRIYRLTGGRIGHSAPGGLTMLLLDHVGAKSGKKRTSPLLYMDDGDDVFIVASKGGYEKSPGWFYNLKANPDTEVQIGSEHRKVHARVATAEEHERLWPEAVKVYPSYQQYQDRTKREIPLVILEKR
ncbi:MAG: nitroreductase family deazaflavin-dependent oxidoreductase [Thermoleophilia bacterium]|nr:nitroreductase family deazaflavin-dependent oxidoreductase [Thermoleophilia bacterium]